MSDPIGAWFHLSPGEEVQVTGVVTYDRHYAMPELAMVTVQVDNLGRTRLPQSQVALRVDPPVDEEPQTGIPEGREL